LVLAADTQDCAASQVGRCSLLETRLSAMGREKEREREREGERERARARARHRARERKRQAIGGLRSEMKLLNPPQPTLSVGYAGIWHEKGSNFQLKSTLKMLSTLCTKGCLLNPNSF